MHDSFLPHSGPSDASQPAARVADESWVQPSSSRMLTNYLADVEQNLDELRWELALRDVADLPRIAVALADPQLKSSPEQCKAWCAQWVRPVGETDQPGMDQERVCRILDEKAAQEATEPTIPKAELRRLRLRRHARNAPRGFSGPYISKAGEEAAEVFTVCTAVVEGVRRWYAHFACHDATAQANLARLAVLR